MVMPKNSFTNTFKTVLLPTVEPALDLGSSVLKLFLQHNFVNFGQVNDFQNCSPLLLPCMPSSIALVSMVSHSLYPYFADPKNQKYYLVTC